MANGIKNERRKGKRKADPSAFGPRDDSEKQGNGKSKGDGEGFCTPGRSKPRPYEMPTLPLRNADPAPTNGVTLERGEVLVEVGYGFDAAEIVFQGQVFVGGVGVFVGEAEAK